MATTAPTTAIGYTQTPTYTQMYLDDEMTPELQWPQSIAVYDQMRKTDSQCASVLRAVTLPVRRTPWRIDPNGARPEVVEFVADNLGLPIVGQQPKTPPRTKDRFSWSEHLRLALLMLPMGHAYFEQLYRVEADGSRAHLRKLEFRPSKTIEDIQVAPDGGLISIKQYWTRTNTSPKPIPVSRLVAYVHEREGGNWLGSSILRSAYKNFLLKERLLRVQAQTIERNGMGIPVYEAAETEASLDAGLSMATKLRAGEAAGSAIPHGAKLRLMGVEGTLPDADPVVRYHDEAIARAVLAHFLNLGTQTGSWALGTTFADFFTLSLQTLAQQIADTATQHIIEDLVDINFGESEPAPRLVFDEIGSRQAATAQAMKLLVDAGLITPDAVLDENLRQQYGLPPADPATATPPPAQAPPSPAPEPEPVPGEGSVAVSAGDGGMAELLDRALRVIAQFEKRPRPVRRAGKARVTAHLPGEHNQKSHGNLVSSPLAIAGIKVMDSGEYAEIYGDVWDDAGIDLGLDGDVRGLTARYFENGDLHVVLDLEDGKSQVLEDLDPEGLRQFAYTLEDVLAVDETEYEPDNPYDVVADADSDKHSFYVAKDGVGDIRISPSDAEDDDYLELSEEQARDFVDKLLNIADSYEEHFDDVENDDEVVARQTGTSRSKAVVAHLPGQHDQRDHGRKKGLTDTLKVDVPKPARKKAAPKAKPDAKVDAPKAPARKRAAPKPSPETAEPTPKKPATAAKSPRVLAAEEHVKKLTAGLPASLRKPVTDALLVQAQLAPGSVMKLRGLGTADLGGSGAEYKHLGGMIDVNSRWQTNKRGLDASFRASRADGYLTPSGSPTQLGGAVAHEFGHRIAFRSIDPTAQGMRRSVADKLLGPLAAALGVSPPPASRGDKVPYPVIKQWMATHRKKIAAQVSEYGSESVHEMLAEAWQEFSTMGDKARPAAKAVGGALLAMFEGGGS